MSRNVNKLLFGCITNLALADAIRRQREHEQPKMDTNNTGNAFMQMTVIGAAAIRRVGRAPVMSGHADAP
jgi:hypothetical protein